MFIAIGGVPRSGKSTLAVELGKQLNIASFPIDALIQAFQAVYPEGDINYDGAQREEAFFPALLAALEQVELIHDHYVIEGEILTPALVTRLAEHLDIRPCFLGLSRADLAEVLQHEGRNAWLYRLDVHDQQTFVSGIVERSSRLRDECRRHGYPYFDMSEGNYGESFAGVLAQLADQMRFPRDKV